ncbi:hypothetical protein EGM88_05960 [Aureibaculum marinum]|uniref:Uncharacterized protein n=1 Tax=Aureibaculum marinum TaxID=2487930 RepID=A0A3N4NQS3_9FLAO|nr:DUF6327 family protein [Aureibaculum marinum]RPD98732.1 hypothetical protein EGM88_05960 [Aureibaculum marinum]
MNKTEYNSFEDIDKKLKILKLKREIDKENIKIGVSRINKDVYPTNLLHSFQGAFQEYLLITIIKKLRKMVG